jgi:hypothetical protein
MATMQEFGAFMFRLATAIPRFAPNVKDPALLDAWFAELGKLDTPMLSGVYREAIAKCDAFPSIRELLQFGGLSPQSDEDKGRDVAERIWSGIGKFGSVNGRLIIDTPEKVFALGKNDGSLEKIEKTEADKKWSVICEYLGPIGLAVVKTQGGWNQICNTATNDNQTTLKAQWREYAAVIVRKQKSGTIDQAPTFDSLPTKARPEIAALCEKVSTP